MSLAKLHKLVDLDQLPEELGGQLPYQHKQWVKNRLVPNFISLEYLVNKLKYNWCRGWKRSAKDRKWFWPICRRCAGSWTAAASSKRATEASAWSTGWSPWAPSTATASPTSAKSNKTVRISTFLHTSRPINLSEFFLSFSAVLSWRFLLAMPIFIHFFRDLLSPGTIH